MAIVRFIGGIVLAASLLAGCGKKNDTTPAPEKPATPAAPASNAVTTAATPAPAPESGLRPPTNKPAPVVVSQAEKTAMDESFMLELAKIDTMEQDAQFAEAIRYCVSLQSTRRDPKQQDALGAVMSRLLEEKEEATNLRQAIKYLSSGSQNYIQVARQKLLGAGELGRIFLRKAMREEKEPAALLAAELLVQQTDTRSFPVFANQMLTREPGHMTELMANSMRIRISAVDTNLLSAFHSAILTDTNLVRRDAASVLATAYDTRCHGNVDAYNQLVGTRDGFTTLRDYVERALLSTNTQAVAWACQQGGSLIGTFSTAIARYYAGIHFGSLTNERPETQIALSGYGKPPFPGGPSSDFSTRWTGLLEIPKAGTYTFHASADDGGSLSVGTQVLAGVNNTGTNMTIELQPGRVPISAELVQREHGYNIRVDMSGPDMPRRLVDGEVLRSPPWSDAVLALRPAIRDLVSTNWTTARAARARLAWGFTAGDIYLRDALRTDSDPVAARAAEQLASRRDPRAPALLIERIEKNPASPSIPDLTVALRNMAPALTPDQVQHLYKTMLQDADASMLPHASALCALLNDVYGNDKTRFNQAVQDPKGYDQLQRYVQQATVSANDAVVMKACEFGAPFIPYLSGLRGQYFYGQQFDELAAERLEGRFELNDRSNPHPLPQDRRGDCVLRWTGFLRIDTAAAYTFYSRGNSTLFIDDQPVVNNFDWTERPGSPVTLAPGWHRLKAEGAVFEMSWSWTNVAKQIIAGNIFRTPVWRSALLALPPAIDNLASTNLATARAAAATLAQAQEFGPVFLRNAIRYKADPVAKAAATILAGRQDAPAAALLVERIRKSPDATIVPDLLEELRELASFIPESSLPALLEAVRADKDVRMIPEAAMLCMVLDRAYDRNAAAFNGRAKDAKAHELLSGYVTQALASGNDAVVINTCRFGDAFLEPARGLRGRYYLGQQWNILATERTDASINFKQLQYPVPANWQRELSARWSGTLEISQPGDYTLWIERQQAQADLWIDGKNLSFTQLPGRGTTYSNTISLAKGTHRIRLDAQLGGDWNQLTLQWNGPGINKEVIPPTVLRTPPCLADIAKLPAAINSLGSTNKVEFEAAKAVILQAGGAGKVYLKNAASKTGRVAEAATKLLTP